MDLNVASKKIKDKIAKSKNILLHLHPSPDFDSIGSALTMAEYLESIGKKVTVIRGDSSISKKALLLPGIDKIVNKNIFEIDLNDFDLFLILDSAAISMVSQKGQIKLPEKLITAVIDHHQSNPGFGTINYIDTTVPATGQILFELFQDWNVKITETMAINLLIAIYSDTLGYRTDRTSYKTLYVVAELTKIYPKFNQFIDKMETDKNPGEIYFMRLVLDKLELLGNEKIAYSGISKADLKKTKINADDLISQKSNVCNLLKSVKGWEISIVAIEVDKDQTDVSLRTKDPQRYDVSKIAQATGFGGGHQAAAGIHYKTSLSKAKKNLMDIIKEVYPELFE